jgi:orotidine-5'-phosphate decarboxylase
VLSPFIIALDFNDETAALRLVEQLDPQKVALKVGLELFTRAGAAFVRRLVKQEFKIFLDLKFHDIPNTVASACKVAADLGVWMLNVHASGGLAMMQAARAALPSSGERPYLIAVTVLTSLDAQQFAALGIPGSIASHVLHLARLAKMAQLDGLVCSAHEVSAIKADCGPDFLCVTPGIRLAGQAADDQSRLCTPEFALQEGSDYLVLGRSITKADNPAQALQRLLQSLEL